MCYKVVGIIVSIDNSKNTLTIESRGVKKEIRVRSLEGLREGIKISYNPGRFFWIEEVLRIIA